MKKLNNYGCAWWHTGRKSVPHWDDMSCTDEHQLEVYAQAMLLMKKHGFKTVADVGCGSAYKLVTYLGEYDTLGLEVADNIPELNKRYPDRKFMLSDFSQNAPDLSADVIICSDVIEHLINPDELLLFLKRASFRFLVLSTPVRERKYKLRDIFRPWRFTIPRNPHHVREWAYREFPRYIASHGFDISSHLKTRGGQMIICGSESKQWE